MKTILLGILFLLCAPLAAQANLLPARLAPDPPFPRILEQAPTIEAIAPGVEYADYRLVTQAGPLAIHVVALDPHRRDVHLESVLANDALESRGETVGSMARRTDAVAGINGDYFDIGNTNEPENVVVRDGALLHMPYKRYALAITRTGTAQIGEFSFAGQVQIGDRTTGLDAVDELPAPNGGISLLTPAFGRVPPEENVTLVALQPLDGTPPLARYRVTAIADNLSPQPPGYYLAIGPNAYGTVSVPDLNATVTATGDLMPVGLAAIAAAIGGGPLILHDGQWYDDPDGPRGHEYAKRIPCSGAAIAPDGRLFLIEVDGREPALSVGLKRPEFAALMRALGATEGLAFDGGGSSTIVVRRLGDARTSVVNVPSDGKERRVANGLFVYSTAPAGPAVRLVARPGAVRALPGASIALRVAAIDAASHVTSTLAPIVTQVSPPSLGAVRNGTFTAWRAGTGSISLNSGRLHGNVPVDVEANPANLSIDPPRPNTEVGGTIALRARAFDAGGYELTLPARLAWHATRGSIDSGGLYHASNHDADVTIGVGRTRASTHVTVGSHEVPLAFTQHAHFTTIPHGGGGSLARDPQCAQCVTLQYAFSGGERAAYAAADLRLPANTIGLAFDLRDDGSTGRLRVAVRNAINEDVLLDATRLDQPGWRHITVRFPTQVQAALLVAIYVLASKGMEMSEGSIILKNVRAVVAGQ